MLLQCSHTLLRLRSLQFTLENFKVLLMFNDLLLAFDELCMDWVLKGNRKSTEPALIVATLLFFLLLQLLVPLLAVVAFLHFLLVELLECVFKVRLQFLELIAELDFHSLVINLVLVF